MLIQRLLFSDMSPFGIIAAALFRRNVMQYFDFEYALTDFTP
jgi:hypothetical protein